MDSNIQYCNLYTTNSDVDFNRRQTNEVAHELTKHPIPCLTFVSLTMFLTCIIDRIANQML